MAFPTIPTVAAGRVLTTNIDGTGTRTFPSLSSLTKNAGDLLIAIIVAYQSSSGQGAPGGSVFSSWGASFTEFCDQMTTNSSTIAIGMAYKISDGTETGTFTVTQAATITGGASLILLSIPGAHQSTAPEVGTIANGTAAAADPASFNPTNWDAEDTLWICVTANGMTSGTGSWTGTGANAPTNFGNRVDTNRADDSTIGRIEGAVSFRQQNAASQDVGTESGQDTSNARNSSIVVAIRPAPSDHALSIPMGLGDTIVTALARETFVSIPDALGNDIVTNLVKEKLLSIPDDLGLSIVTALSRETFLSVPDDLGLGIVSALARETFISIPDPLGLQIDTALARETFLSVPDDLGLVIVSDLVVTGGGAEHFLSVPMALGDTIVTALVRETFLSSAVPLGPQTDSALLRETFVSIPDDLGLQIASALVRETFLSLAENFGPQIASAIVREMFIGIPDDLGLAIYSNLFVSNPGAGGGGKNLTLLGVG